jgi:hypothetical protein
VTITFDAVSDARFVRLETTSVDGWVIIHEVEVYAG